MKSFWEQINSEILPNALMIGVNYELFWKLNPKTLDPFVKAFKLKQTYDDTIAWQSGLYIRMAIGSLIDKSVNYPSKPFSSNKVGLTDEDKIENFKNRMLERMIVVNKRFEKEGVNE